METALSKDEQSDEPTIEERAFKLLEKRHLKDRVKQAGDVVVSTELTINKRTWRFRTVVDKNGEIEYLDNIDRTSEMQGKTFSEENKLAFATEAVRNHLKRVRWILNEHKTIQESGKGAWPKRAVFWLLVFVVLGGLIAGGYALWSKKEEPTKKEESKPPIPADLWHKPKPVHPKNVIATDDLYIQIRAELRDPKNTNSP